MEPSGPLQACNGIALPLPLTLLCVRLSKLLRMLWGICVLVSTTLRGGPNIVVRVATCYRLDIPDPFRPVPRAVQPHEQWVPGTFPGDKAAGGGAHHPPPLALSLPCLLGMLWDSL